MEHRSDKINLQKQTRPKENETPNLNPKPRDLCCRSQPTADMCRMEEKREEKAKEKQWATEKKEQCTKKGKGKNRKLCRQQVGYRASRPTPQLNFFGDFSWSKSYETVARPAELKISNLNTGEYLTLYFFVKPKVITVFYFFPLAVLEKNSMQELHFYCSNTRKQKKN